MELAPNDVFASKGYGGAPIEPGEKPAILVVDLQHLHTDPRSPLARAPLIDRAVENTAPLLRVARERSVPVYQTVVAWDGEQDMGLWSRKIPWLENVTPDSHWAKVDPRIWDDRDTLLPKKRPSFFHGTPLHSLLTYAGVDTVIITGATTSGCVRATIIDALSNNFRALVPEDCVGDHDEGPHWSNLTDVHRRYAEVTTSAEVVEYVERIGAKAGV